MIDILIEKDGSDIIRFLSSKGHATNKSKDVNYSKACFGVSLFLRTWVRYLALYRVQIKFSMDDGFLECTILDELVDRTDLQDIDLYDISEYDDTRRLFNISEFLILGLQDLQKEYPKDITLKIVLKN